MSTRILAILLMVCVCCRSSSGLTEKQAVPSLNLEDEIRACVFRYQFSHYGMPLKEYSTLYFITISEEKKSDPSSNLIAYLQSNTYQVKPASQERDSGMTINDVKSGMKGIEFDICKTKFISKTRVMVTGNCYRSRHGGITADYTVEKIGGSWKVTKYELLWFH